MSGKTPNETKAPFFGATPNFGAINDTFRDLVGIQFRGAQIMMDRSLQLGQVVSDSLSTMVQEQSKLAQECIKAGWALSESIKNQAFELTERASRTPSSAA